MSNKPKLSELLKARPVQISEKKDGKKFSEEISIKKPKKPRVIPSIQPHTLNEENLIIFIKQTNKTKPYELKHRFYESSASEIHDLLDKLFQKGLLEKTRNGWIYLKKGSDENV